MKVLATIDLGKEGMCSFKGLGVALKRNSHSTNPILD